MVTRNEMRWCGLSLFAIGAVAASACSSTGGDANGGSAAGTTSSSSSGSTSSSGTGGTTSSSSSTSSSTGTTTSSSSSSTSNSSSSSPSSGSTCSPTADANALSCPNGLCSIGNGGYDFTYADPGPNTSICIAKNTVCVVGTLSVQSAADYGAGLGINLGPAVDGGTQPAPVQLTGTGITVKLSNIPAGGARLQVTVAGTSYCAAITTNPATIPWASFNTKCYDAVPDGVALSAAPATPNVDVVLPAGTTQQSFDFCVEQLTLTTQ